MIKKCFLILFALFLTFYSFAQDIPIQKLDSLINHIDTADKAIGSISVYKDGKEVYKNSFGYENIEDGIKASEKTKYRVVSMSKMFTSAVIIKLIKEGKLTFETKLSEFYPDIVNADKITIKHMLSHQSGIQNYDRDIWLPRIRLNEPKRRIYEFISNYPSVFEPGTNFNYSNTNFVLLG